MSHFRPYFSRTASAVLSSALFLSWGCPSQGATYPYTNGQINSDPIQFTEDSTLTIASGAATQAGALTVSPVSPIVTKTGDGTLTFGGKVTLPKLRVDNGTSILAAGVASSIDYVDVYKSQGTANAVFQIKNTALTSTTLYIGNYAAGELRVTDGAVLTNPGFLTLGAGTNGNGSLVVDGAGSVFTNSTSRTDAMEIGDIARGSVTLSNGGKMTATSSTKVLILGNTVTGTGTVNIGAASGQAATGAGILALNQVYTNGGTGEIVFNHTSTNYYFTQTGVQGGTNLWIHGAVGFRVENGTTTLTDINTNTGNTIVTGGKLLLSKVDTVANPTYSTVGTGTVTVGANGTLGGVGRVNGLTTVSGTLSPGNSAGLLNLAGGLTLNSGSVTRMELGGLSRGTQYDAIDVAGALNFNGTLQLVLINSFTVQLGDTFNLFGGSHTSLGNFTNVTLNSADFAGSFNPSTGIVTIVVPEPSTFVLALFGCALCGLYLRRRITTVR